MIHPWRMRRMLQALLDGELSVVQCEGVTRHLDGCPECGATFHRLEETERLLRMARPEPAALSAETSRALLERALAEVASAPRARVWGPSLSWRVAAAAALAAVVLGGWQVCTIWGGGPGPGGATNLAVQPPVEPTGPDWKMASDYRTPPTQSPPSAPQSTRPTTPPRQQPGNSEKHLRPAAKKAGPTTAPPPLAEPPRLDLRPRRPGPPRYRFVHMLPSAPDRIQMTDSPEHVAPGLRAAIEEEAPPTFAWAQPSAADVPPDVPEAGAPDPVEAGGPAGEASATVAELAPPQFLVIVTDGPAPSPVAVTQAPEGQPGFARASALRPDASGQWVWAESTISTEGSGPEQSLVIVGEDAGNGDAGGDPAPSAEKGDENGIQKDSPGGGAPERVRDGSDGASQPMP